MDKAGMRREGRLARYLVHPNVSDEPRDAYLYAITR
jgi:RimJ/RimL family protein N-acetyltransferase